MWMTLNSSKVVHLFRCAVTSSFIYKYRGGNLSLQQEGLIYIFFHFLQSSFVTFSVTLPQKKPYLYQVQKTTNNNKEKENEWMNDEKQSIKSGWEELCELVWWNSSCYSVHDNLQLASQEQEKVKVNHMFPNSHQNREISPLKLK